MTYNRTSHILHLTSYILPLAAALMLASCNNSQPKLESTTDTLSWALGESVAQSIMANNSATVDKDVFLQAISHTLDGKPQPISDSVYMRTVQQYALAMQMQQMQERQASAKNVEAAQQEYFKKLEAENPNVKRHPSGFYYEVLRQGKGPNAKYAQRIRFDYKSYLMFTGEPYDQTYGKRDPIIHVVGNPMFKGLIDGFQLMNAGSIYRFYFPYQLAFGENGSGDIPGQTPFIYEIELHNLYND